MVPFGGWEMPLQYAGVLEEHRACREHAVVFDVSHLGTVEFRGAGAHDALQWLLTNDLGRIEPGSGAVHAPARSRSTRTSSTTSSCGGSSPTASS